MAEILSDAVDELQVNLEELSTAEEELCQQNEELIVAHEELCRHQEHLEELVRDRTGELEDANTKLQEEINEREAAEKAVKAERQRFIDVLETLPAYAVLLSADYHVPFANRFFRERFDESHGRCCFEYLFGRSQPCEICEPYTVMKTNAPHRWEWIGPDGRNYSVFDFPFKDTDGAPLVDKILDTAGQKGTGKWTVVAALDEGMPLTLIGEAVFARCLSALKEERELLARRFSWLLPWLFVWAGAALIVLLGLSWVFRSGALSIIDRVLQSSDLASARYGALKAFIGASMRSGPHAFKASYGLQLRVSVTRSTSTISSFWNTSSPV